MGKAVQRVGDKNSAGGAILQGDSSVMVDGKNIAVDNKSVSPHQPVNQQPHCTAKTKAASSVVKVNGKAVIVTGDKDTCGHPRIGGSGSVFIG